MCAGGVQERIDRALAKISDNILDLNTDAKKKRTLDIKIVLTPSEDDREDVAVEVQTSVKLAPEMGLKTQLFINKDFRSGVTTLTEHAKGAIKGQLTLDECGMCMDPEKDSTPTAEELGCNPETGEVLEEKSEPPKESTKVISMRDAVNSQEDVMYDKKPMELADTAEMMMSKDYKERFRAQYCQVVIRYQKLKAMLEKWDNGELNFTPTCPRSTYNMQIKAMTDYIAVLEARAVMENVELQEV